MYRFNKRRDDDGWKFELNGINFLIDDFYLKGERHWIKNPKKAISFFSINGSLYGILNDIRTFDTLEDFYEAMCEQYTIFKSKAPQPIKQDHNNKKGDNLKHVA
ncbi:MAG TPA: hypothetical protein VN721_11170 [Flavipsychrobacter sp.]|nr:hypothetical protein [Flavipsychrobacter sp.]